MDGQMIKPDTPIKVSTGETIGAPNPVDFTDIVNVDILLINRSPRGFGLRILNQFIPDTVKQICMAEFHFNGYDGLVKQLCKAMHYDPRDILLQPRFKSYYEGYIE